MPLLGDQVWDQVDGDATLLVPLGATEQHGPHLPLDTDSRIAVALSAAAGDLVGATVAPVLAYGASGEHGDFPGTLSIGTEALRHVMIELVRSASRTWQQVVFVNGHGGNHPTLRAACEQMVNEGHRVRAWWPSVPGGDAHAGHTETSLLLAIAPEVVNLAAAEPGNTGALIELLPQLQADGVRAVSPNGVLGDPTQASPVEGHRMFTALVNDLADFVRGRRRSTR